MFFSNMKKSDANFQSQKNHVQLHIKIEKSLKIESKYVSTQCIGSEYNSYYFSQISSHIENFAIVLKLICCFFRGRKDFGTPRECVIAVSIVMYT